MHAETYADGIGEISVTGSVVRIDLVSLSPLERDTRENPKTVFKHRIVMPIDAFANSADLITRVLQNLVETGALRQRTPIESSAVAGPVPTGSAGDKAPLSPNFMTK